ncbi:hypothetical protein BC826DRAFT_1187295 [Russula brevipes]|nr:hypothetical protein BC826DRAFT_1187295 [Russula brevipes]
MLPCQPRNLSKPVKPINRPRRTSPPPDLHNQHLQRRLLLPFLNAAAASLGIRRACRPSPAIPHPLSLANARLPSRTTHPAPTPDTSPVIPHPLSLATARPPGHFPHPGPDAVSHPPLPYNREACNNARPPGYTPHPSRSTGPGVVAHPHFPTTARRAITPARLATPHTLSHATTPFPTLEPLQLRGVQQRPPD